MSWSDFDVVTLQFCVVAEFSYLFNITTDVVADVATLEFVVVTFTALFRCRDFVFRCHDIRLSIFNVSAWL